jgi:acyl dehydratase
MITGFDVAHLGQWTDDRLFEVTAERTIGYARATGDNHPQHTTGELAPPVFAVVPGADAWNTILTRVVPSGLVGKSRSVHGEHDLFIHQPIKPGMLLRTRAAMLGLRDRSTGAILTVKTESRDQTGQRINDQYLTLFYRGLRTGDILGEEAPNHTGVVAPGTTPVGSVRTPVDPDQATRYAEASGDYSAYHLSDAEAQVAGFPRIFIHGLCTMAMASTAIVQVMCPANSARLWRLAVRFSAVVYPGQVLTTSMWALDRGRSSDRFAFEVVDSGGTAVVKQGLAEIGP